MVVFEGTDLRFDGGAALEVAFDLRRHAPLLAGGLGAIPVLGRSVGAALSAIGADAVEHAADIRRQQGPSVADRLLAIGKDCAAHLKEPFRSAEHGELLYGERGLPR